MASAGTVTVGATDTVLFDAALDGGKATTLMIRNPLSAAADILVNVETLHKSNEYVAIPPGDKEYFRINDCGIGKAVAKVASGTQSVVVCVVAKTSNP